MKHGWGFELASPQLASAMAQRSMATGTAKDLTGDDEVQAREHPVAMHDRKVVCGGGEKFIMTTRGPFYRRRILKLNRNTASDKDRFRVIDERQYGICLRLIIRICMHIRHTYIDLLYSSTTLLTTTSFNLIPPLLNTKSTSTNLPHHGKKTRRGVRTPPKPSAPLLKRTATSPSPTAYPTERMRLRLDARHRARAAGRHDVSEPRLQQVQKEA